MDTVEATFHIDVCDPSGGVVSRVSGKSDSFLRNFMQLLKGALTKSNQPVVTVSGETVSTYGFSAYPTTYDVIDRGIVIGSGSAAVTADDFALDAEFPTSVFRYSPVIVPYPRNISVGGEAVEIDMMYRSFANISDTDAVINELGIKFYSGSASVLVLRDVLTDPVTVPAGFVVSVKYVFNTPAGFSPNFLKLMGNSIVGSSAMEVVDTTGALRSVSPAGIMNVMAPTADISYGIVVGSDATPATAEDHAIVAPIPVGDEDGSLIYGQTSCGAVEVVGSTIRLNVARGVINMGEVPVTIREAAMICNVGGYNILLIRAAFDDFVVPPGEGANIDIVLQTTV